MSLPPALTASISPSASLSRRATVIHSSPDAMRLVLFLLGGANKKSLAPRHQGHQERNFFLAPLGVLLVHPLKVRAGSGRDRWKSAFKLCSIAAMKGDGVLVMIFPA